MVGATIGAVALTIALTIAACGDRQPLPPPDTAPSDASAPVVPVAPVLESPSAVTAPEVAAEEPPVAPPEPEEAGGSNGADETLPPPAPSEPPSPPAAATEVGSQESAIRVAPSQIRQGETVLVKARAAEAAATLTVAGSTWPMVREADQWVGYVPISPLSEVGPYTVMVDLFDAAGTYQRTLLSEFTVVDAGAAIEHITLEPGVAALLAPELVAIDIEERFVRHTAVSGPRRWQGPWQRPLAGLDSGAFGALRSYNDAPPSDWHHGHDIDAAVGTPIRAPAAGMVVFAGELPVHGWGVILDHGAGVYSGYWHMSVVGVVLDAEVAAGDLLGEVGESGVVAGPHLHWEVIVHGRDVDPVQWLGATLHE